MASADQEMDKSEKATPQKKAQARKRGQVPKSTEVNTLGFFLLILATIITMFDGKLYEFKKVYGETLSIYIDKDLTLQHVNTIFLNMADRFLAILLPFLLLAFVVGVLVNLIQVGFVFAPDLLKPDFDRINPVNGIKKFFTKRTLYEIFKAFVKLIALSAVIYVIFESNIVFISQLMYVSSGYLSAALSGLAIKIAGAVIAAYVLIAILDLIFVRFEYEYQLRMSRKEMKDEVKRREGDPKVRSKMKQLQRENYEKSKSAGRVKDSDVLITNPEHFAIGIKYEAESMAAPVVYAKGRGQLALQMITLAKQAGVPVLRNPPLARALYRNIAMDSAVSQDMYEGVADALVWAKGVS